MIGLPLKGQRALVTGAASGIGAGVARALGAAGASVAVNYVTNPEAAEAVVEDIRMGGAEAMGLKADVSREDEVQAMIGAMLDAWGTIDILVNNGASARTSPAPPARSSACRLSTRSFPGPVTSTTRRPRVV